MTFYILLAQAILIGANLVNVRIDAYKILKTPHKSIKHGVNLAAYLWVIAVVIFFCQVRGWFIPVFILNALAARQIFFDIPLNWRRGLKWHYVTPANPPAAWWDRVEISIFGRNGKTPVYIYSGIYLSTLIFMLWLM